MRTLFADSGYWIALLHTGDQLHERARTLAIDLGSAKIVTTQMALI
ncbi:MAG: nucleic acid-binding protein, partial [Chloroflexi bacterium]|nr:nucleic acid-binding protein [Chloroflexota bacterium]